MKYVGMGGHKLTNRYFQEGQILAYRLEYHIDLVRGLRRHFKLPPNGLPYGKLTEDWFNKLSDEELDDWEKRIGEFMANIKIPQRHFFFVKNFILNNDSDYANVTGYEKIDSGIITHPETGVKKVVLYLDADVKPSDFKDKILWKRLRSLQEKLPDNKKSTIKNPIPKLEVYKQIYDWHTKDKLSYAKINQRLPELGIKQQEDYQTVGTFISRYKKYIGVK